MKDIDVIVLCGGQGTRLQKVVSDRPKTMADINGVPFLDILLNYLTRGGFNRFILCTGYMADYVKNYYEKKAVGYEILFSYEHEPLGTGGAVKNAEKLIRSNPFLVVNGDSFCSLDFPVFIDFHNRKKAVLSMSLVKSENANDYGQVILDDSCRVISFKEKSPGNAKGFINAGIYLARSEILSMIPKGTRYSLENDLFPKLAGKEFYGFVTHEKMIDIGTPERYESAMRFLGR